MSPRPATFRRTVCLIAALAIGVRLSIAAVSWRATERLAATFHDVTRAHEVIGALEAVRSSLDKAQSAELAFLLAGRGSDRAELDESERAARRQLAHAWTLAAGDEGLQERFGALAKAVDRRFELKDAADAARRSGMLSPEKAAVVVRLAADATAQAGAAVDAARAAELSLIAARTQAQQRSTSRALLGIGATAVASIVLIIGFALWLLPAFDERVAVRDALRPGARNPTSV